MHGRFPGGQSASTKADTAKITATTAQLQVGGSLYVAAAASIIAWPPSVRVLLLMMQTGFVAIVAWRLFSPRDMLAAPFCWSLLGLAFAHAFIRLIAESHRWDKTAHRPDISHEESAQMLDPLVGGAGRAAA